MKKIRRLWVSLVVLFVSFGVKGVQAQPIIPAADGTGTAVTSPPNNPNQFDIEGGTVSGNNLFHSLEQFGLNQNQIANFISNPNIRNILSRVVGGDTSVINGLIMVTGGNSNLYLLNPAGIILGPDARLNVPASFTATTANGVQIGDYWFQAMGSNNYAELVGTPNGLAFTTNESGVVFNAGNLAVSPGESIALVGGTVVNTGTLSTPGGNITIGAVPGKQLVRISQEGNLLSLDLPVETEARLNGGTQPLTPLSLPQLLRGENLNQPMGVVVENDQVKLAASGTVIPNQPGTAIVSGKLDVSNTSGTGGTVNVVGDRVGVIGANVNASGVNGGGRVLVGGDYQGQGMVSNAQRTYVSGDSVINADALTNGHGGVVIIWADETTGFYGNVSAGGGSESGDGGFVEVSGKQNLIFRGNVDISASNGTFGILLLDPTNITISNESSTNGVENELPDILQGNFAGAETNINAGTLQSQNGNVVLEATNDIRIADGVSLIFVPGGAITFTADSDGNNVGAFSMGRTQSITAPGRELTISGATITAGNINTAAEDLNNSNTFVPGSAVNFSASNGNIIAGRITATRNITLQTQQGDITVQGIEIVFVPIDNLNDIVTGSGLTVDSGGLFRVTGVLERTVNNQNYIGSILLIDGASSDTRANSSTLAQQPKLSITHGGRPITLDLSDTKETLVINGGNGNFGFVVGSNNNGNPLVSGSSEFPEGISGTSGSIVSFTRTALDPDEQGMVMFIFNSRSFSSGGEIGTPRGEGNATNNGSNIDNAGRIIEIKEYNSICKNAQENDNNVICNLSEEEDDEILQIEN